MPKLISRKASSTLQEPVLGQAPKAKTASRSSGRIRSLSATVKVVDEETRKAAQFTRLELYEADNYGDDITGANTVDEDEEFFVDDNDTAVKSRTGTSELSLGKQKSASAATLKRLREKRAHARRLAEVLASETSLMHASTDASTGVASMGAVKLAVNQALTASQNVAFSTLPAVKYVLASVGMPKYPARVLCSECGVHSKYSCTRCGARYCSHKCGEQHKETRCLSLT